MHDRIGGVAFTRIDDAKRRAVGANQSARIARLTSTHGIEHGAVGFDTAFSHRDDPGLAVAQIRIVAKDQVSAHERVARKKKRDRAGRQRPRRALNQPSSAIAITDMPSIAAPIRKRWQ